RHSHGGPPTHLKKCGRAKGRPRMSRKRSLLRRRATNLNRFKSYYARHRNRSTTLMSTYRTFAVRTTQLSRSATPQFTLKDSSISKRHPISKDGQASGRIL